MLVDQNRIELKVRNGIYDEAVFEAVDTATLLPGTLVELVEESSDGDAEVISSQAADINGLELAIVLENALIGTGIHAKQYAGETLLLRRPVEGDTYLVRAKAGSYYEGQPVFATQTPNGIYVSASGEGRFVGWAQEFYKITEEMIGLVDDSTRERPASINLNGVCVNLLKVRIGHAKLQGASTSAITFTAQTDGKDGETDSSYIRIKFADPLQSDLDATDVTIQPSTALTTGTLTKENNTTYKLAITPNETTEVAVGINKSNVSTTTVRTTIYKANDAMITYTVTPTTTEANGTTKLTINLASAPASDLIAANITLSPATTVTKGALDKVNDTTYDLTVTPLQSGSITAQIQAAGVETEEKVVAISYVDTTTIHGYWGVCYPDVTGTYVAPTAAQILALSQLHTITGNKRDLQVTASLNQADYTAAGGTEADVADEGGRLFLLSDWGNVNSIYEGTAEMDGAFDNLSLTINDKALTGYISSVPVLYENNTYDFNFVKLN